MTPRLASPLLHLWPCPTSGVPLQGFVSWPALKLTRRLYQTCPEEQEEARHWEAAGGLAGKAVLAPWAGRCPL